MARPDQILRANVRKAPNTIARSQTRQTSTSVPSSSTLSMPTSKRGKRQMKRSLLLSRLHSTNPPGGVRKISTAPMKSKRRRPNRKLAAAEGLQDLVDALPETARHTDQTDGQTSGGSQAASSKERRGAHFSVKSGAGLQKKKDRIGGLERERFLGNLGIINAFHMGQEAAVGHSATAERFSALREHIAQNLRSGCG